LQPTSSISHRSTSSKSSSSNSSSIWSSNKVAPFQTGAMQHKQQQYTDAAGQRHEHQQHQVSIPLASCCIPQHHGSLLCPILLAQLLQLPLLERPMHVGHSTGIPQPASHTWSGDQTCSKNSSTRFQENRARSSHKTQMCAIMQELQGTKQARCLRPVVRCSSRARYLMMDHSLVTDQTKMKCRHVSQSC